MVQVSGGAADTRLEASVTSQARHSTPSPLEAAGARGQAVRVIGTLWILGGVVGALFLALPHTDTANEGAVLALIVVALISGSLLILAGPRLPRFLIHAGVSAGTGTIALSIFFSGDASAGNALLFVWPVVFSAYFFRPRELVFQLAVIAASYGVVLVAHPHPDGDELLTLWLTGVIGLTVAGGLMALLIRQRREAERSRQHLASLVEASTEPIIGASPTGMIQSWNRGAESLFGYSSDDAVLRPLGWLEPTDHRGELDRIFEALRGGTKFEDHETTWLGAGSQVIDVSLTLSPMVDGDGAVTGVSITAHDISERKHLEQVSERLLAESEARARTDPLTAIANRRAWDEELRRELARAARQGWPVCVAMIDLDHFKQFNDEQGHLAGDELLKESAAVWSVVLREGDFIARYGGEEFSVLLPNCSTGDAVQVVERLRVATPMGQRCSAGVAIWDGSESASELLHRADAALYSAKRSGRDRLLTA